MGLRKFLGRKWMGEECSKLTVEALEGYIFRDRPRLHGIPPTRQTVAVENGRIRDCLQRPTMELNWSREGREPTVRPRRGLDIDTPDLEGIREVPNGQDPQFYRRAGDRQPQAKLPLDTRTPGLILLDTMAAAALELRDQLAGMVAILDRVVDQATREL